MNKQRMKGGSPEPGPEARPGDLAELLGIRKREREICSAAKSKFGCTAGQILILLAVCKSPGASQTGLVELTGIDRSTLAEMVRLLSEKGFLDRSRAEGVDERRNQVLLTAAGKKMADKLARFYDDPWTPSSGRNSARRSRSR